MPRTMRWLRFAFGVSVAVFGLVAHAHAATLYAAGANAEPWGGNSALYIADKTSGQLTWIGSLGTAFSYDNTIYNGGIAYDPYTDRTYALGCDSSLTHALFLVDRTTARVTRIGYLGGSNPYTFCSGGLAFDIQTRKLFAAGDIGVPLGMTVLAEIDPNSGAATTIGGTGTFGTYLWGLGCDPATGVLYANGYADGNQHSALFTVNKATGHATMVGYHGLSVSRQMNYSGLAVDPATGLMYGLGSLSGSEGGLFVVDKSSGEATPVGPTIPQIGVDGGLVFIGADVLGVRVPPAEEPSVALRAWPSPARGPVSITFALPHADEVTLGIYDLAGRRLSTLVNSRLEAGPHETRWDGHDAAGRRMPGGVYFATLRDGEKVLGRATLLMRR